MCQISGHPLRTYQNYETDVSKAGSIKYNYMLRKLEEYGFIDETHGVLTTEQIRSICSSIFEQYHVDYCFLFGSYAKGNATALSDVDLKVVFDTVKNDIPQLLDELNSIAE